MSSEDNGMYDNDQIPQDMHPLNPYYPVDHVASNWTGPMMFRADSEPASAFTHVDHPTSSPVVVGANDSMPSDCQSSHDFVMDCDDTPSMMFRIDSQPASAFTHVDHQTSSPVVVGMDDSMPTPVPSGCQSSHGFVMNYTPHQYRGGYDSPYYGSSVLGPPLYGGYNIGSPQTEGDMMMRAYLASRRG